MSTTTNSREAFIEWARHASIPLSDGGRSAAEQAFASVAQIVGNARVVALGESWHSSTELLALKNRMVRYLVQNLGFNALAFEGGVPGSPQSGAYVRGGAGSAEAVLRALGQPMWLNRESIEIVDWLREYGASGRARGTVDVFGIDPAYPGAAIGGVLSFLERVDPKFTVPHRGVLEETQRALLAVPLTSASKSAVWGATGVYESMSGDAQEALRAACNQLVARLEQYRATYSARTSAANLEWALRNAVALLQAIGITSIRSRSLTDANIVRDHAFAENLIWFLEHGARNRKVVVLAHNIHVAREPFFSAPLGSPIPSMGGYLAEWLGTDYVAIGSAVGRGRAGNTDEGLAGVAAKDEAKLAAANESNDAALEQVGVGSYLLPLASAHDWASKPRLMRSHLEPQPHYSLKKSFDAVFYVDRITRCAPLESPVTA